MEEYEKEDNLKISDYNSALFINKRLSELWEDANKHKRKGKYADWNGDIDAVWCELAGDVDEGGEEEKKFELITKKLGAFKPILNWDAQNTFNKANDKLNLLKANQYKALMEKEIFLRRLQNTQGKGTKYRDDADDYMDS